MKVLITGAAGHVGSILRPAFEAEHDCRYFDLVTLPSADDRWMQGDLLDEAALAKAIAGMDAIVHLAMGDCHSVRAMYDVNVTGMHLLLQAAQEAGVHRIVYASTMSIYQHNGVPNGDESSRTPDAVTDYGLTKRLSETIGEAFVQRNPDLSFIALRLYGPVNEAQWAELKDTGRCLTAPNDLRRIFLAAVACTHKGFDGVFVATDLDQRWMRLGKAQQLLGWKPEGN